MIPHKFWKHPCYNLVKVSEHFNLREFMCPCCGKVILHSFFLYHLQALRYSLGVPLILRSAYRCWDHNKAVGGSDESMHMLGRGADVWAFGRSTRDILRHIKGGPFLGVITSVGRLTVHLDTRDMAFVDVPKGWL